MRPTALLAVVGMVGLLGWAGAEETPPAEGLVLAAAVTPAEASSGTDITLAATFRNAGAAPIEVFLPPFHETVPFPLWVLEDAQGVAWTPTVPSFQTMWQRGLQGSLLALAPGEARTFTTTVRTVVRRDPTGAEGTPPIAMPPEPGRYTVRAVYEQVDATVPWSPQAFDVERQPHPGLWTGTARSDDVVLTVLPGEGPVLRLEAPETVRAGDPYPVTIRVENPRQEPLEVAAVLDLWASSKPYGTGRVALVFDGENLRPLGEGAPPALRLAPGASRSASVDLAALSLAATRHGQAVALGLYDVAPEGLFRLQASLHDADRVDPLATTGGLRGVTGPELGAVEGLELRLAASAAAPGPWKVEVILRNVGTAPVRVPPTLAYPRHVFFSIRRSGAQGAAGVAVSRTAPASAEDQLGPDDPDGHAAIEPGLAWDGDRFEPCDASAAAAVLAPQEELRRAFVLTDLVADAAPLAEGSWLLTAFWRNAESGRRLGETERRAVGLLGSAPIPLPAGP